MGTERRGRREEGDEGGRDAVEDAYKGVYLSLVIHIKHITQHLSGTAFNVGQ